MAQSQTELTVIDIESAINYWRGRFPSEGDAMKLCAPASALCGPYARMIYEHLRSLPLDSLDEAARRAWSDYCAAAGNPHDRP